MLTPAGPGQPYHPEAVLQPPSWNTAPTKQSYAAMPNQGYKGVVTNQPCGSMPAAPGQFTPSIPPPLQNQPYDPYSSHYNQPQTLSPSVPPPPPTVSQSSNLSSSRPPSVGPLSKSKYILDPSVKSPGPAYGSSGYSQNPQIYGGPQQQTFTPAGFPSQTAYQVQYCFIILY